MAIEDHTKDLETCTYCPKLCRHACPVSNALGNETLIPQSKMELLNLLRKGTVPWQSSYTDPLFACTGCKLCQQYCDHGVDVPAALWEGRAEAQNRGVGHPALGRLPERYRQLAEDLRRKLEHGPLAARMASEARVAYLPGVDNIDCCLDDLDDAFFVFDALGLEFVKLVEGPLLGTGDALRAGGFGEAARFASEEIVRHLRNYATVVVASPAYTHLLRVGLPAQGFEHNTEVLHVSEFLAMHADRLQVRRRRFAAYYHDPCYLGRYLGVYEAPRRLLARCVDSPREYFHSRDKAECCGGAGLIDETYPDAAIGQARHRLEEPRLFGVDLVVTSCPTCKRALRAAHGPLEVLNLINLVAWALRAPDELPPHEG